MHETRLIRQARMRSLSRSLSPPWCERDSGPWPQVFKLGVRVNGELATRKALGDLFDSCDADHSGWLDLQEAQAALKAWEEAAIKADKERMTKERHVRRIKNLAARKLQAALRDESAGGMENASDDAVSSSPLSSPGSPKRSPSSPKRRPRPSTARS